jgi:hypothetical protein
MVDRGQFVLCRKRDDKVLVDHRKCAWRQDQSAIWGARKSRDVLLNLPSITDVDQARIHSDRGRH